MFIEVGVHMDWGVVFEMCGERNGSAKFHTSCPTKLSFTFLKKVRSVEPKIVRLHKQSSDGVERRVRSPCPSGTSLQHCDVALESFLN